MHLTWNEAIFLNLTDEYLSSGYKRLCHSFVLVRHTLSFVSRSYVDVAGSFYFVPVRNISTVYALCKFNMFFLFVTILSYLFVSFVVTDIFTCV